MENVCYRAAGLRTVLPHVHVTTTSRAPLRGALSHPCVCVCVCLSGAVRAFPTKIVLQVPLPAHPASNKPVCLSVQTNNDKQNRVDTSAVFVTL